MAKPSSSIKSLTPNAIDIPVNGENIRVPTNKHENAIMNMLVAAQMRNLIQETIKKYKEDDVKLLPKEIADLAKAARDIAQFSAEIYLGVEDLSASQPKPVEPTKPDDSVDFSALKETKDGTPKDTQAKQVGPDSPVAEGPSEET